MNGVTLTETADYDWVMGTLLNVTDANNNTTSASYDEFGRMTKMWKPGDTQTYPTVQATYVDAALPFRYQLEKRETAGATGTVQRTESYYDGLGRLIQTKRESARDGNNAVTKAIIVDKRYDGLGQVTQESQPREVSQNGTVFTDYTIPPADLNNPTLTSYDALGRPTQVQSPDGTQTNMSYTIDSGYRTTTTIDARYHQTQHQSDMFGRLRRVIEYSGNNNQGPDPEGGYAIYATTTYAYSPLDLLSQVTDQANNVTQMGYDSLGRKTSMQDPDMSSGGINWTYQYDANGNLIQQTDARGQFIIFGYDALDRLISKNRNGDLDTSTYTYDGIGVPNGKGQRTSSSRISSGSGATYNWQYDTRGRVTRADYSIIGAGTQTFLWSYDSGDRIRQLTYPASVPFPTGERVTYEYDPAGRPITLHSLDYLVEYVSNPHYTALDQPQDWALGNGLVQTWQYDSVTARLNRIQVGTSSSPASLFDRGYTYDTAGNVKQITKYTSGSPTETQTFTYDHRDRLTNWAIPSVVNETYGYNTLGNLTTKAGVAYSYGPRALGSGGGGPHAVITAGGQGFTYDANGNMLTGGNLGGGGTRSLSWNADNQPTVVTSGGVSESYAYDADGERIKRVRNGVSTYFVGGLLEIDQPSGVARTSYTFNGQVVATRSAGNEWWTNLTGVTASGNTLTKSATSYNWDSGASSIGTISSIDGTGYAEARADSTVGYKMFGLGIGDSSASYTDLDFAWELQDGGGTRIYENGTLKFDQPTSYTGGSIFRVALEYDKNYGRNVVKWYKNGTVLYIESNPTISYPLVLDTSIYTPGASVSNAYLVSTGRGGDGHEVRQPATPTAQATGSTAPTPTPRAGDRGATQPGTGSSAATPPNSQGIRPVTGPRSPTFVNTLVYLHSDHLGSVSLATNSAGQIVNQQEFKPWGEVRSGTVPQTAGSYTGQQLDGTGLLYYHARYYDPVLARFTSADSIVPGAAMGAGEALGTLGPASQASLRSLTVDFHENSFAAGLNQENTLTLQKGFYFQLSDRDRSKAKSPSGPSNPQALNRYSYALNNPIRYTDPTGHTWYLNQQDAARLADGFRSAAQMVRDALSAPETYSAEALLWLFGEAIGAAAGAAAGAAVGGGSSGGSGTLPGALLGGAIGAMLGIFSGAEIIALGRELASAFDHIANAIDESIAAQQAAGDYNGVTGVEFDNGTFYVADCTNMQVYYTYHVSPLLTLLLTSQSAFADLGPTREGGPINNINPDEWHYRLIHDGRYPKR